TLIEKTVFYLNSQGYFLKPRIPRDQNFRIPPQVGKKMVNSKCPDIQNIYTKINQIPSNGSAIK
ncbi:MAG: hypothetical protein ACMUIG_04385, partial [Thermoplasmatota archaeon]